MESKKSPKADLEKRSTTFFLIGIALSLLMVLVVFQYEKQKVVIIPQERTIEANLGPDIPITIRKTEAKPEIKTPEKKINHNLPPEEVPNETLVWENIFKGSEESNSELTDVPLDPYFGDKDEVETIDFVVIEKMARPKECEKFHSIDEQKECLNDWIQSYLSSNARYPEISKRMGDEDRVYVTFIISENGDVEKAWVERGQFDALNDEALRVVKAMPDFVPGSQHNKPVKMKMTIPVNFKLSSF